MPYLTIVSRNNEPENTDVTILSGRPFTVGRGAGTSLRIRDVKMSRVHCELSVSGGMAVLTDLGSMNGTYVNGKRIASTALKDGDVIQIGYTKLQYHEGELNRAAAARAAVEAGEPGRVSTTTTRAMASDEESPPRTAARALAAAGEEPVVVEIVEAPVTVGAPGSAQPDGPDDRAVAEALGVLADRLERPAKKGEKVCGSCRQPVTAKELKSGAATDVHGQVCCARCRAADVLLGTTIAGCRVEAKLGTGAWSATYKAEQLSMARPVVLRVVRPEVASDREFVTQFLAAAKRGGQISHPNLIRVYDIGRTEQVCYVSAEYIDGESLAQAMRSRPRFTVGTAAQIVLDVTGAVDIAHRRDVVHRDIRPSSVILNDEGIPKLTGLGLARSVEEAAAAGTVTFRRGMDLVLYWAPECLVNPARASREADVYALGAVLYTLLAGHPPFESADPAELVGMIRRLRPRPLAALRPDVPQRLSAVVAKAMAKAPADRYGDCQQFAHDLRNALG